MWETTDTGVLDYGLFTPIDVDDPAECGPAIMAFLEGILNVTTYM